MNKTETTAPMHPALLEDTGRGRAHTADGLRQFIAALHALGEAASNVRPDADVLQMLDEALTALLLAVDAKDGSLLIHDEDTGELVFVLSHGDVPAPRLHWRRLPRGQGIASWVVRHRRAAVVNNTAFDERFYPWLDEELEFRTRSILAAPLIWDNRVLGVIEALNKRRGRHFSTGDQQILGVMCRLAGEVLNTFVQKLETTADGRQG